MNIEIKDLQKAEIFVSIFQHIKQFTECVNLIFDNERFYMQSMDSSKIIIFEIILPSYWFSSYKCERKINLGLNSTLLFKVLNSREKTQSIFLEYKNGDDKIFFHFLENKGQKDTEKDSQPDKVITAFDKHFELPLADIDNELFDIPNMDHQAEFSLNSVTFANLINQLKNFGDNLQIKCSEEQIELNSFSVDNGKMYAEIPIEELNEFSINEGEILNLSFGLKYLHNICLYQKLNKEIEIKISENFPMVIMYKLGLPSEINDTTKRIDPQLCFYLAPKLNDEY